MKILETIMETLCYIIVVATFCVFYVFIIFEMASHQPEFIYGLPFFIKSCLILFPIPLIIHLSKYNWWIR